MFKTNKGFTFLDLLFTLAAIGIISNIALTNLAHLQQSQHLRDTSQTLISHLLLARSEAVKRKRPVLVAAEGGGWPAGWLVFADMNGNNRKDADDIVLQNHHPHAADINIKGNSPVKSFVRYTPDGRTKLPGGAFQAGTIGICHNTGKHPKRQIVISASGRVREEISKSTCS